MILADKIIMLRKKNGWTQEEFAEKMKVSRQAVSKWEGAQTIPDLDKILAMSSLFGVTTDYLLKDEIETEEYVGDGEADVSNVRKISMEEANEFLKLRKDASVKISIGTFLCVIASIPLILLTVASETGAFNIPEIIAIPVGLCILLITVAVAVILFVLSGLNSAPYEFLEKEPFETVYGVDGMVKERQHEFRPAYIRYNIAGACLCVLSPIPLLTGAFLKNEFYIVCTLGITMLIAGIGAMLFVRAGVYYAGTQKLLREGEYAPREKRKNALADTVSTTYWLLATAVYLVWSFVTDDWEYTWLVWVVAGVLYAPVMCILNLISDREDKE